tara:strand:- start:10 stop:765 length:756 start_codon:yes stop_codon:yes gene_type:complete
MDNNIKASTYGSLSSEVFFDRKVSISFDSVEFDPTADFKVLVQIEPPTILDVLNPIIDNQNNFDLILAWHPNILSSCSNSELFPFGSCWIDESDRQVHEKSKLVSIISSHKKQTVGHNLRHQVINEKLIPMDVFGRGYQSIDNKVTGLKNYMFSLIIENDTTDNWFTEKLIDCLVNGTVPVYWGCRNIDNYFNMGGFIRFDTIEEFNTITPTLNKETYTKMLPFINENFNLSLKYVDFWSRIESTIKNKLL